MNTLTSNINLFGFGTVGKGFYSYLKDKKQESRLQSVVVKTRKNESINTTLFQDVDNSKSATTIVELVNNDKDALQIVTNALKSGKKVISANKKLLATNFQTLYGLEKEFGGVLLYEGAVCGSVPIIRILNDLYSNEKIIEIKGVLNGSSNYILTRLFEGNTTYEVALRLAQQKGFAEADPTSDVGGFDALYKLILLSAHAFGSIVEKDKAINFGIESVTQEDISFAKNLGLKIKQVARAAIQNGFITLSVAPTFVDDSSELFSTDEEYNGVIINSQNIGTQFYKGKGAGSLPTGAVVYSDLQAADNGYRYAYSKLQDRSPVLNQTLQVEVLVRTKGVIDLPYGFNNVRRIESGIYYAKVALEHLKLNQQNLTINGLSVLFIDNESVKQKILNHASTTKKTEPSFSF